MRQKIHIIRKIDLEQAHIAGLKCELDYHLSWLSDHIANGDRENIEKTKVRLREIQMELQAFESKK